MLQKNLFDAGARPPSNRQGKEPEPYTDEFEKWWALWPRKISKRMAFESFKRALRHVSWDDLMRHTLAICESEKAKGEFCPHATTYLNQQRWTDDPAEWHANRGKSPGEVDWDYKA